MREPSFWGGEASGRGEGAILYNMPWCHAGCSWMFNVGRSLAENANTEAPNFVHLTVSESVRAIFYSWATAFSRRNTFKVLATVDESG